MRLTSQRPAAVVSACIARFCATASATARFRQFFKTIPDDVVHAARLDGLSELAIVWKIMVPMALPAIIAFGIFSVVGHWNSLFWPLIAVRDQNLMPPPLGIMAFKNEEAGVDTSQLEPLLPPDVAGLADSKKAASRAWAPGEDRPAGKSACYFACGVQTTLSSKT